MTQGLGSMTQIRGPFECIMLSYDAGNITSILSRLVEFQRNSTKKNAFWGPQCLIQRLTWSTSRWRWIGSCEDQMGSPGIRQRTGWRS